MHMFQSSWTDFADFEQIFMRIKNTISGLELFLEFAFSILWTDRPNNRFLCRCSKELLDNSLTFNSYKHAVCNIYLCIVLIHIFQHYLMKLKEKYIFSVLKCLYVPIHRICDGALEGGFYVWIPVPEWL